MDTNRVISAMLFLDLICQIEAMLKMLADSGLDGSG